MLRKLLFIFILSLFLINSTQAQCPMCKLAAESNLKEGDDKAVGLNTGILYLLGMPFLFAGGLAIVMYRRHKEDLQELSEQQEQRALMN